MITAERLLCCDLCGREQLFESDPTWITVPGQIGVAEVDGCRVRVPRTMHFCSQSCRSLWLVNALLDQRSLICENLEVNLP